MSSNLPVERDSGENHVPVPQNGSGVPALSASLAVDGFAPPDQEEPALNPRRLLAAVLRYKWIVLCLTALGGAGGFLATKIQGPVYEAQATIWMELGASRDGPITNGPPILPFNWVDLLRSFTVLDSVVKEQHLFVSAKRALDAGAFRSFNVKERFQPGSFVLKVAHNGRTWTLEPDGNNPGVSIHGNVGDSVGLPLGFSWVPPQRYMVPDAQIAFTVVQPRQAALAINQALNVRAPVKDANFISMTYDGSDPFRTAATLNSLTQQFVSVAADLKTVRLREQTRVLDLQLASAKQELERAEAALETFKVNTITEPTDQAPVAAGLTQTQTTVMTNFFAMRTQQDDYARDRRAIEAVLAQPPDSGITAVNLEAIPSVTSNIDIKNAIIKLSSDLATLNALRARFTDENPQVIRLVQDIHTEQRQDIPRMLRLILNDLRQRQAALDDRVNAASRDLRQIPQRSIEEARLNREVAIASQLYTTLQQRYSEARLAEASEIPDVRILDAAVVPDRPLKNIAILLILGGFGGGIGLGIGLALLLDKLDRRIRYPEQVTRGMGLTILGALPRVKSHSAGMRGDDAQQVLEALRSIRLNVVNAYGSAGPLITTITSPGSGDGKSFLASNLALAFADAGHRTLLIDGDIRRGTLHRVLNVNRKPGLLDFLSGQATKEQVIQSTRMASVDFIGCGTRKIGGPELLASPAMSQLLIELRGQYGVIIMDSAPLGAGVDPLVLGSLTGSLMLVLRTGVTDRELAQAKLSDLDRLPIRILGAVLNDVKAEGAYKYYSYLPGYSSDDETEVGAGARTLTAGKS